MLKYLHLQNLEKILSIFDVLPSKSLGSVRHFFQINTFTQQRSIKLIKCNIKDILD